MIRRFSPFFILLIGDDGAMLLPVGTNTDRIPLFASDVLDESAKDLFKRVAQNPTWPVHLLVDTSQVRLQPELLPSLPLIDRRKLARRRLAQAFNNAKYRALHAIGRNRVLLYGIDGSGCFDAWKERLVKLPNPPGKTIPAPLEVVSVLTQLDSGSDKGWTLFLLWSETSGFRQVVTQDGQIVLTRLATLPAGTSTPQAAAALLAVDLQSTRHYLARLGLPPYAPLAIVAIVPTELQKAVAQLSIEGGACLSLSTEEAAEKLNLSHIKKNLRSGADTLILNWCANHLSRMHHLTAEKDSNKQKTNYWNDLGLFATRFVFLASIIYIGTMLWSVAEGYSHLLNVRRKVQSLESEWKNTQDTIAPAGEPLGRLRQAIERQRLYEQITSNPLTLWTQLSDGLNSTAQAVTVEWKNDEWILDLRLEEEEIAFSRTDWTRRFDNIALQMQGSLPGYIITVIRYPFPNLPNETLFNASRETPEPIARYLIHKEVP